MYVDMASLDCLLGILFISAIIIYLDVLPWY